MTCSLLVRHDMTVQLGGCVMGTWLVRKDRQIWCMRGVECMVVQRCCQHSGCSMLMLWAVGWRCLLGVRCRQGLSERRVEPREGEPVVEVLR